MTTWEAMTPESGGRPPAPFRAAGILWQLRSSSRSCPMKTPRWSPSAPMVSEFFCRASGVDSSVVVGALTARAMAALPPAAGLDPAFAITRALGHCASDDAEKTLAAWLSVPSLAPFAPLGLGDIASRKKTLTEATQMALLAAAEGAATREPSADALYPFSRLEHPHNAAASRLREIATRHLGSTLPTRIFAVRALARAGSPSIAALARVLSAPVGFTSSEKIEAARGLAKFGIAGQDALERGLLILVPAHDALSLAALGTASFGPLMVTLESLQRGSGTSQKALFELAHLSPPDGAPAVHCRRVAWLRCRAAALLVNGRIDDPLLAQCDTGRNRRARPPRSRWTSAHRGGRGSRLSIGSWALRI